MKLDSWLNQKLFRTESNAPLEIFRIAFGLLMLAEAWGALALGWVDETFVQVNYTFPFFGFEWTQALLGAPMIAIFFAMGVFSAGVMLGYKYRFSILMLAILWSLSYFMQKSHYNNHYYLVMLVCWIFVFFPVGKRFSLDVKLNPQKYRNAIPGWPRFLLIALIAIVYFFAATAKLYPDWLEARPLQLWLSYKANYPLIGGHLQAEWLPHFMAYSGIAFDFLIVPMLLWKPTRWLAILAALSFHLFNSVVFQIGIFPYFALAFSIFFFPTQKIERWVSRGRDLGIQAFEHSTVTRTRVKVAVLSFLILMLFLPVRHHFIPGDVLWTEAGHRLSWRMMLRTKIGLAEFTVIADGKKYEIDLRERLARHQRNDVATKPDMMFLFSRYLEKEFEEMGYREVEVYARTRISVNGRPYHHFTDESIDLTEVNWNYWGNQSWILPRPW